MKQSLIFLVGGVITGIALCLAVASMIPLDADKIEEINDWQ